MRRAFFICAVFTDHIVVDHILSGLRRARAPGIRDHHRLHAYPALPHAHACRTAMGDVKGRSVHRVPGLTAMRGKHAPTQARQSRWGNGLPLRCAAEALSKFWKRWRKSPTSLQDEPESGILVPRQSISRARTIKLWGARSAPDLKFLNIFEDYMLADIDSPAHFENYTAITQALKAENPHHGVPQLCPRLVPRRGTQPLDQKIQHGAQYQRHLPA